MNRHVAKVTIEATVTHADGTVENLGVVGSYARPWWKTLLSKFTKGRTCRSPG